MMMIMRVFWALGLAYMVTLMVVMTSFMFQSDEELSKPSTRSPQNARVGAGMLIVAMAIGALGTLGFLAQIWRQ